jgi:glutaredoxin
MAKKVHLYTRNNCAYCALVKKYFTAKNIAYETTNMDEDDAAMQKIINMSGRAIGPTTLITDESGKEELIVGFNLGKIAETLR